MNKPDYSAAAAQIVETAAANTQLLEENATANPALAHVMSNDEASLKSVLERQDKLYGDSPYLIEALQAFKPVSDEAAGQKAAELDIPKRMG